MRNLIKMSSVVVLAILCAMPVHAAETKVNKMTTTDSGLKYVDLVVGKGASTDIIVASAKAYIHALNRLHCKQKRLMDAV